IGTGVLNRLLRQAFESNPPPLTKGKRLKLFYTAQTRHGTSPSDRRTRSGGLARESFRSLESAESVHAKAPSVEKPLPLPEFVLFVNDPRLMNETYRRYLEARIRKAAPYPGLPIVLTLRQGFESNPPPLVKGKRLKLLYAAQTRNGGLARESFRSLQSEESVLAKAPSVEKPFPLPEFVLFVNDPRLMNETYRRYLEARIRKAEPYPGLPIVLTLRQRTGVRHDQRTRRAH
ncbi:MAG: hypothetical protein DMF01_03410, partial [Verrucomicrobia bacterium]